jgi:NADPH:quinone reductase-like Zn-dependent oxidoreductase
LITAAGGGVGRYAVQMASQAGARVLGTASRDQAALQALGLEAVINYREEDVAERVRSLTDGRGVDAVIDLVSSESATAMTHLLRHNGAIASVVGRPVAGGLPPWGRAITWHDLAVGFAYQHGDGDNLQDLARAGETVAGWVAAGRLDPQIHRTINLDEVPEALREAEAGTTQGKVVIRI